MKYLTLILFTVLFWGCNVPLTQEEKELISDLSKKYAEQYTFDTNQESYLLVYAKESLVFEDLKDIRLSFVGKFPKVRWSYVNAYNNKREFMYQLSYDPDFQKIVKGYEEFDF
jgi:hypothetical protein